MSRVKSCELQVIVFSIAAKKVIAFMGRIHEIRYTDLMPVLAQNEIGFG